MLVFTVHTCGTVKLKASVLRVDFVRLVIVSDELIRDNDLASSRTPTLTISPTSPARSPRAVCREKRSARMSPLDSASQRPLPPTTASGLIPTPNGSPLASPTSRLSRIPSETPVRFRHRLQRRESRLHRLHIVDDPDYSSVPKATIYSDAAYDALPVDDNSEVVSPAVPTDSRFQLSPTNSSVIGQSYLHVHTSL